MIISERYWDLSVACIAIVYVLNIVDAAVDAHLYTFDVSENLTFTPIPYATPYTGKLTPGMRVAFKF